MPPATYLKAGRASLSLSFWSCFGWGLHGSACYQADGSLLSCLSTLTGKPPHYGSFPGGISLLHWPWSRLHRTLSGILPCEARTFLTHAAVAAIACPAYTFRSYHKPELLATPESFLQYASQSRSFRDFIAISIYFSGIFRPFTHSPASRHNWLAD